ncbi:MAG: hypothetical protein HC848_07820 [Limnobacter sp.]|nr:hypothetical protein [Limnobacter sp.]
MAGHLVDAPFVRLGFFVDVVGLGLKQISIKRNTHGALRISTSGQLSDSQADSMIKVAQLRLNERLYLFAGARNWLCEQEGTTRAESSKYLRRKVAESEYNLSCCFFRALRGTAGFRPKAIKSEISRVLFDAGSDKSQIGMDTLVGYFLNTYYDALLASTHKNGLIKKQEKLKDYMMHGLRAAGGLIANPKDKLVCTQVEDPAQIQTTPVSNPDDQVVDVLAAKLTAVKKRVCVWASKAISPAGDPTLSAKHRAGGLIYGQKLFGSRWTCGYWRQHVARAFYRGSLSDKELDALYQSKYLHRSATYRNSFVQ